MADIVPLDMVDLEIVDALLDAVFGEDRHSRTAYKVRDGMEWLPGLSFAAVEDDGRLVGSIQCWPVMLSGEDGSRHPMIMVGPVAVSPDRQDQGIGRALMRAVFAGLNAGERLPLVLIGDPDYYSRLFGYTAERTGGWDLPGPFERERLLAICHADLQLPERGMLGPYLPRGR